MLHNKYELLYQEAWTPEPMPLCTHVVRFGLADTLEEGIASIT